jgi:hypothetical protein
VRVSTGVAISPWRVRERGSGSGRSRLSSRQERAERTKRRVLPTKSTRSVVVGWRFWPAKRASSSQRPSRHPHVVRPVSAASLYPTRARFVRDGEDPLKTLSL